MNKHIKKQLISRDKNLYYDFLPEMAELIEKPENRVTTIILYLCFILIIITIGWACLMKLDVVVTAGGYMDTDNPVENVRFLSGGKVAEVYVVDGTTVEAGDIICKLDSENETGAIERNTHELEALNTQLDLYEKIYEKYKDDDFTALDESPETYGEYRIVAEAVILENDIFIDSLKDAGGEEKELLKKNRLYMVTNNINRLNLEIEEREAEADSLERDLESRLVKAGTSGVVTITDKLYIGKTVAAGENVCSISKTSNDYIFKAFVTDEDIVSITGENNVRLRIPGYDDTKYEYTEGVITHISDLPMKVEGLGTVYAVDISMGDIPTDLKPGMEGKIDMIIGERTVMDYFLEPFRKGLDNSLSEK